MGCARDSVGVCVVGATVLRGLMSEAIEPLAVFTDYRDLVVALRHRIVELGTHMTAVGEVAGLPTGYTAKVLSLGQATPALGRISMGPILQTLGLKLALVADEEALAKVIDRLPPRGTRGPKLGDAELGVGWIGA
jgi:hypothetical protein